MLVIVVGVGWRCTPTGHEPCHLLFSLGVYGARPERYQADGRGQQWYAGMTYTGLSLSYRRCILV